MENMVTMETAQVGTGCEVTKMQFDTGDQGLQLRSTFPLLNVYILLYIFHGG